MTLAAIGPIQTLLFLVVPVLIFMLGYFYGRKSGYIKRVKEEEEKEQG